MKTLWEFAEEQQQSNTKDSAEDDLEKERQEILERVSSHTVDTIRDKVAWVLNHFPETRDSDITLQIKYWETFDSQIYKGGAIYPKDLYELTRLTTISRARATIQNDYRLFLASPAIREMRGTISDEELQRAIEAKLNYPVITVYMDDSGKTAQNLIIGSLWFLSDYRAVHKAVFDIKERTGFKEEFHFKNMKPDDLPIYMEVVDVFWQHSSTVGFKLISVPRSGLSKITDAVTDLYYHLLLKGIEHEQETNRAPLPRTLQVWIDSEETSLDKLRIANLDDRLRQASISRFETKLSIDRLIAVDSKKNTMMQIADLFTGSVNRVFNLSGTTHNHKDEFAKYFLNRFTTDLTLPANDKVGDIAIHITV
jgi:hypothetical protein